MVHLDRENGAILLPDGSVVPYDILVLCTGLQVRAWMGWGYTLRPDREGATVRGRPTKRFSYALPAHRFSAVGGALQSQRATRKWNSRLSSFRSSGSGGPRCLREVTGFRLPTTRSVSIQKMVFTLLYRSCHDMGFVDTPGTNRALSPVPWLQMWYRKRCLCVVASRWTLRKLLCPGSNHDQPQSLTTRMAPTKIGCIRPKEALLP